SVASTSRRPQQPLRNPMMDRDADCASTTRRGAEHDNTSDAAADDLQELLTVDDVAARLRVSKSWVYEHTRSRRVRTGQLASINIGKYVRFDARAVNEFLQQRTRRRDPAGR